MIGKKLRDVSIEESVKIIRKLQEFSQNELAELTGISQSMISAIEYDKNQPGNRACKKY